jgi:hypothetical protein
MKHYKSITSRSDAESFWGIMPEKKDRDGKEADS